MRPGYRRQVSDADRVLRTVSEGAFMKQIIEAAKWLGWMCYHTYDARMCELGFPDLVMVHPHQKRVIVAELKRETGRLSPEQLVWIGAFMQVEGVEVYTWRPRDIDAAMATLAKREVGS